MERKRATDFPQDLLNLFDRYVHGEISRRQFLDSAAKFAVGGLTVAAIWESLRPDYALAAQVADDDNRIQVEDVMVSSPQGNGSIRGYYVRPADTREKLPGVLVIHENRGLNPYIKDVARRLGVRNFLALAPDGLTSVGGYPGSDEKGVELFRKVDENNMFEDFVASAGWLKSRPECSGKIAVVGFCFGGTMANKLAVQLPDLA
ncbi:MAG: dienelactone hydrolase family protein, partial [Verrucomicrobia bacterium]|nr:dienelactone hydrolase family protein [Verrucomicrobiota bacterium]